MCVPLVPALMIASTAISATGSVMQGVQQSQQAKYAAAVAQQNEQQTIQARRDAIDQGTRDQIIEDRKQSQLQGQQRVALAGSGVDTTFGSAADLANDTALIGSENNQTIVRNTDRTALAYSFDASNAAAQAAADRAQASNAMANGLFGAAGTILGGATQVAQFNALKKLPAGTASFKPMSIPTFGGGMSVARGIPTGY